MTNSIYEKMHLIQSELPRLSKDGEFDGGQFSYKFLAVDDVIRAVRPLMNKHGVMMYPVVTDSKVDFFFGEPAGVKAPRGRVHVMLTVDYHFVCVEDGSGIVVTVVGQAEDTHDRAVRKSMTSAQKIAFIQAFSIETGEPDEHELGGSGPQKDEDAVDPKEAAVERKIERARKEAPAKTPAKSKAAGGAAAVKAKIKSEYIDTGKITAAEVNDLAAQKKAELGEKTMSAKVFEAVLATLEEGN